MEVGFSPMRALFGQPGATVTMVRPHIQIVQDLFGPRVTSFDIVDDPKGGPPTVRVMEGEDSFPSGGHFDPGHRTGAAPQADAADGAAIGQ